MDLNQFHDMFFDEAEELLMEMEQLLLQLDVGHPSMEDLDGIFRAAHSIKGGAGTFGCFGLLADTTHSLENVLDALRRGELSLCAGRVDLFLETRDVLADQVRAYRQGLQPDPAASRAVVAQLRELLATPQEAAPSPTPARTSAGSRPGKAAGTTEHDETRNAGAQSAPDVAQAHPVLRVSLAGLSAADAAALEAEMALMGTIVHRQGGTDSLYLWLETRESPEDIEAVCCFIVEPRQVGVQPDDPPVERTAPAASHDSADDSAGGSADRSTSNRAGNSPGGNTRPVAAGAPATTSNTLRVGVEKVDQIINLVGELVITQAMLVQACADMDPAVYDRLVNGIHQLERNARDLQDAVMSIRMMPMDYVFSRFPRVVRESAAALHKQVRLDTRGQATELDKSLIERIIDPLTHLVRNSIDHGIETPEQRVQAGKPPEGVLTLSAEHSGGHIVIEVQDDGAGLNRERILAKAQARGFQVSHSTPDEELWQLLFAPGFSTAETVTAISGRGVGMDVVRRNIVGMGGHVHLSSAAGRGTVTRIVLPLTLAILDGMSVGVGAETFILPLSHVMESLQPDASQLRAIQEGEQVLHVRGDYLPIVVLHEVFDVAHAQTDPTRAIAVILQAQDKRFAVLVDQLIGQHQVVVKNLEANYRKVEGISAATILGDGSVALIIDVFSLMQLASRQRPAVTDTHPA